MHLSQTDVSEAPASEFIGAFGRFLIAQKLIEDSALDRAHRAATVTGERLDQVLTKLGLMSDTELTLALSRYLSIAIATLDRMPLEPVLNDVIDFDFVRRNRVMPLEVDGDHLVVGVVDPYNPDPIRAIAYITGLRVTRKIFVPADFEKACEALYRDQTVWSNSPESQTGDEANDLDVQRLRDMASEAPTIRLVNRIISVAVGMHASDIHIEPGLDALLVRYRIDGLLRTAETLGVGLRAAITSRIKIMAKLDISERRLPQDGRIKIAIRGVDIDFRVSTIPTAYGESVVMRILDRSQVELDFGKLGFDDGDVTALRQLMNEPNGIILVTGPTGSGKTTTLYTALKSLNSREHKIFTVEDPIEYQLVGINQVQVQPSIGLTFPHALRSILRQDPDIIMIGEIRDIETARIAIQASLTGHLVFSTLHTNSAASAITRLIDMGIEGYLLASTIKGILAQRLVRKLCQHCSERHNRAEQWVASILQRTPEITSFGRPDIRQPQGCRECSDIGYTGRTTIAELLLVDAEIHRLILAGVPDTQIEASARESGMSNLYATGARKVWRGETTAEEILRVTRIR
jgi:general secretion pathway protein E